MGYRLKPLAKVSAKFEDIFTTGVASASSICLCGRVHFDDHNTYDEEWQKRNLPDYREMARKNPNKYIPREGSIGTCEVAPGMGVYVVGCDCGGPVNLENAIRGNPTKFAAYLNKMAEEMKTTAAAIEVDASTLA